MTTSRRSFLAGCAGAAAASRLAAAGPADSQFIDTANTYIQKVLENAPEFATRTGDHRYDDRLSDYTPAGRERVLAVDRECVRRLDGIVPDRLEQQNHIDVRILRNTAESGVWRETVLREYQWNPMVYNPGGALYVLLERDFAPLPQRLASLRGRLDALPGLLAAGKQNLKTATHIHTETALQQNKGTIALVRDVVNQQAAKVPGMRENLAPAQVRAIAALEDWGHWLEQDLLPRANRDFRVGPDLYRTKLRYALDSDLTADDIRSRAQSALAAAGTEIFATAMLLQRQSSPGAGAPDDPAARREIVRTVLDRLARSRPDADTVVSVAERDLHDATQFVRSRKLVSVPETPVRIVLMPEFERGVAVANCNPPGPLDTRGETFLNISPPPAGWTAAQVDSYFRENNDFMLQDMVVHEAMPGHYLQLAHSNRFRAATLVRSVFWSGPFVEGWAVYGERLMAEHGYGGPQVRMQQLKMWLRTIINALLDVGIHTGGMPEREAMDLMMNAGFQERSEAAGKWRRACMTSTQLPTYFVGATALLSLRSDYEKKHGPIRDLQAFHDRMLSFGSPPPQYVRELML